MNPFIKFLNRCFIRNVHIGSVEGDMVRSSLFIACMLDVDKLGVLIIAYARV